MAISDDLVHCLNCEESLIQSHMPELGLMQLYNYRVVMHPTSALRSE
jgi:hypothetical protein